MSRTPTPDVDPRPDGGLPPSRWHRVTRALLAGLVATSFMFFLIATVRTPGLDPPPETAALFLVVTAAGVISYQLLDADPLGYAAAILTGGLVFVVLVVVVTGTYGAAGPRTNPVGPVWYLLLAAGVIVSAGVVWRRDAVAEPGSTASSPS